MTILKFPVVNQETPVTSDGHFSENASLDCGPACVCACVMFLKGVSEVNAEFNPDLVKDAALGQGYTGGTNIVDFVPFCKSQGVELWRFAGMPAILVNEAHKQIQAGFPVILQEPNPYGSDKYTHFCVFYGEQAGELVAMDPFIAKSIWRSDADWEHLLLANELWIAQEAIVQINLSTPGVGAYFEAVPGNSQQWRCKQTGKTIQYALLDFYAKYGNAALCGLTFLGLPVSNEIAIASGGIVKQHFERGVLFYDPGHTIDSPPGAGPVYLAHIYSGAGQDPLIAKLQDTIKQLQSQPSAPQLQAEVLQAAESLAHAVGKNLV